MRKISNKKGVEAETLIQIFGVIIAAGVILLLIHVGSSIWGIFSNKPDQGTKESYSALVEKITKLEDNNETSHIYYIKPDFALYGFSKDSDKVIFSRPIEIEKLPVIGGNLIKAPETKKPAKCGGKACLCICDNADCNGKVVDCKTIDGTDYYVAENLQRNQGYDYASKDGKVKGKYLAIFGKKSGIGMFSDEFGVRPIKIRREESAIYFSDQK